MQLIACPWCGPRDEIEFSYGGQAAVAYPADPASLELFPTFARAHVLRTWGGIVDVSPDASPIVGRTPYDNLFLNCGWGTGGFKATPGIGWCLADTIANDELHPTVAPFSLDRFVTGALVDEHGAAAVAH